MRKLTPANRRAGRLACLLLPALLLAGPGAIAQESTRDRARRYVVAELLRALAPPADLNRVSSLVYAIAEDYRGGASGESAEALHAVRSFLQGVDAAGMKCAGVIELRLISAFLSLAGPQFSIAPRDLGSASCEQGADPFSAAGALFFLCRFTELNHRDRLPGVAERLLAMQRPDGGFGPYGSPGEFYLSSHIIFALHSCGIAGPSVPRGRAYLLLRAAEFYRRGFLDGLLESVLMLERMGAEIPEGAEYQRYILGRMQNNGGICSIDRPGCRADWHTGALLLEYLRTRKEACTADRRSPPQ